MIPRDTVLIFRFGILPPGLNDSGRGKRRKRGLLNMHYREYSRLKNEWKMLVNSATPPGFEGFGKGPVALTVVRYSFGVMDRDNAWASMKPVMDGLIEAGIIDDDNEEVIPWPRLIQVKAKKRAKTGLLLHLSLLPEEEREREMNLRMWARTVRPPETDQVSLAEVIRANDPIPR